MKLTDWENDLLKALGGTTKAALSLVPGLGQAIAGYDAYNQSKFERSIKKFMEDLSAKVDDLQGLFTNEWLSTEEGETFIRKVIAAALDEQISEKQELFANALISGISNEALSNLEKFKFIDILRNLSLASLMVLADMHEMFKNSVRGPNRQSDPIGPSPQINSEKITRELSSKYDPYLVLSAIEELKSHGLFSNHIEWLKTNEGRWRPGTGFDKAVAYTDFSCKFVEFITEKNK